MREHCTILPPRSWAATVTLPWSTLPALLLKSEVPSEAPNAARKCLLCTHNLSYGDYEIALQAGFSSNGFAGWMLGRPKRMACARWQAANLAFHRSSEWHAAAMSAGARAVKLPHQLSKMGAGQTVAALSFPCTLLKACTQRAAKHGPI